MATKNIGINVKAPEKECNDKNCPFHGDLKVHGKQIVAKVVSLKSRKTAKVQWTEIVKLPKFERSYHETRTLLVHKPSCIDVNVGDTVKVMETRPISKLKHFVIVEVEEVKE